MPPSVEIAVVEPCAALVVGNTTDETPGYAEFQARAAGTNINPVTLLATDYLNHFNELVMMIELVPDMPDFLDEARAWRPKSYVDHFRDSGFTDKDLAVEAYAHVPERFLLPFELSVRALDRRLLHAIDEIAGEVEGGDSPRVGLLVEDLCIRIREMIDTVGGIINGGEKRHHIDTVAADTAGTVEEDATGLAQDAIDHLFDD